MVVEAGVVAIADGERKSMPAIMLEAGGVGSGIAGIAGVVVVVDAPPLIKSKDDMAEGCSGTVGGGGCLLYTSPSPRD